MISPRRLLLFAATGASLLPALARSGLPPAKVEIRFTPPAVSADRIHEPVDFAIEVRAPGPPVQVDLVLTPDGGSARSYRARSTNGRTFRVSAVPVPRAEADRLLLTVLDATSEAVFLSADRSFTVAGRPVRLSRVRRIEYGTAPRVVLQDGTVLSGPVKGLEALDVRIAGTPVRLEPAKAARVLVGKAETGVPAVAYRVLVRRKGRLIGERRGRLSVVQREPQRPPPGRTGAPIAFAPAQVYEVPAAMDVVIAGDLDGDRRADVVVGAGEELGVLYGRGDGTLEPYQRLLSWKARPAVRAVTDVNGDRRPDILFHDSLGRLVTLPNEGGRRFAEPLFQNAGSGKFVVADLNRDRHPDVVLSHSGSAGRGAAKILLGNGDGSFREHAEVGVGGYADGIAVGDVNGDGHLDLAVGVGTSTVNTSGAALFYGDGTGKFQGGPSYAVGTQNMPGLALEDFNGDGRPDLAVTHYWGGDVSVLLNQGDGTLLPLIRYPAAQYPIQIHTADFDRDGKPDMAVPSAGKGLVSVYRNRGNGTFYDPVEVPSGGENSRSCAVADFNRDGRPDVVVQHETSRSISVLLNTGGR